MMKYFIILFILFMMKYWFIFFLCFLSFPGFAQEDTLFNRNYPLEWQYDANSMVIIDNAYYLSGNIARTTEDCPYWLMGYHITKINSSGERDTTVIFDQCEQETYIGWQGSILNLDSSIYIVGDIVTDYDSKIQIVKYNYDLDTIANWDYLHDTLVKRGFSMINDNYNDIIFCGGIDSSYNELTNATPDTTYSKGLLQKIDTSGVVIWSHSYAWGNISDGCWNAFTRLAAMYDNGIAVIGSSKDFSNNAKPIILKTDSLGNEEWVHAYGSNTYSNPRFTDIIETKDSCILVCGAYTYGETYGGLYPYDGWLIKLNPDGSTVWNKKYRFPTLDDYAEDSIYCYFKALTQLENGNIAIAFQSRRTPNGSRIDPSLLMLNEYGDTLFSKHYVFPIGNIEGAAGDLWVNSIVETPDSGIAISGYGEFKRYDETEEQWTLDQRIFLIKTDSLGNDHFVSVSEPQTKPITRYELMVYPNPASNYLFVETHENSQANGELTIVNQSGQIVYQNHVTNDALSSGICVSNFTPGNYLIQLNTENKTFFGKFVKY